MVLSKEYNSVLNECLDKNCSVEVDLTMLFLYCYDILKYVFV